MFMSTKQNKKKQADNDNQFDGYHEKVTLNHNRKTLPMKTTMNKKTKESLMILGFLVSRNENLFNFFFGKFSGKIIQFFR